MEQIQIAYEKVNELLNQNLQTYKVFIKMDEKNDILESHVIHLKTINSMKTYLEYHMKNIENPTCIILFILFKRSIRWLNRKLSMEFRYLFHCK